VTSSSFRLTTFARIYGDTDHFLQHQIALSAKGVDSSANDAAARIGEDEPTFTCAEPEEGEGMLVDDRAQQVSTTKRSFSHVSPIQGGGRSAKRGTLNEASTSDIEDEDEDESAVNPSGDDDDDEDATETDKPAKVVKSSASVMTVKKVGLGAHNEVMVVGMECYERFDHAYFASRFNEITSGGLTAQAAAAGGSVKAVAAKSKSPAVVTKVATAAAKGKPVTKGKQQKGIGEDEY
jgi:hypothetical protein